MEMGMRELREKIGLVVRTVERGETITLTYRNAPIAILKGLGPIGSQQSKDQVLFDTLETEGLVGGGSGRVAVGTAPLKLHGRSMAELTIDERE